MDRELVSGNSGELIGKLSTRWEVGKATIYKRLEYLGVAISKANGESFLYSHELSSLDELNEWIKARKSLVSFPKPGALVQSESGEMAQAPFGLSKGHATANVQDKYIGVEPVEEGHQIQQLLRTAKEKAAGVIIAQNILAAKFQDSPEMLDPDLLQQVRASEEAIAPKSIDPLQYAHSLVNKLIQTQKGLIQSS